MSKVYVLTDIRWGGGDYVVGVITDEATAEKWSRIERAKDQEEFELDDPELLNRIAKEGR